MSGVRKQAGQAESAYGPGWFDVWGRLMWTMTHLKEPVEFVLHPTKSINGKWGLRLTLRWHDTGGTIGACGYGPAFANGAKTMAGAAFHALIKAEAAINEHEPEAWVQGALPLEGEGEA